MLDISRDGPVLKVWLNKPDKRNAVDTDVLTELASVFAAVQAQYDIRVVELSGHGDVFCAGADLASPPGITVGGDRERRWISRVGARALDSINSCEALTVARIQGPAVGGGLALALACDFRVMSTSAYFSLPEVALGVPLGWGSLAGLVSLVGSARAKEMLILNEPMSAKSALDLGLVTKVATPHDLDAKTSALIDRLVTLPEYGISATKSQFRAITQSTAGVGWPDGDLFMFAARDGQFSQQTPAKAVSHSTKA